MSKYEAKYEIGDIVRVSKGVVEIEQITIKVHSEDTVKVSYWVKSFSGGVGVEESDIISKVHVVDCE